MITDLLSLPIDGNTGRAEGRSAGTMSRHSTRHLSRYAAWASPTLCSTGTMLPPPKPPPQPMTRAKSLPVPTGSMATGGMYSGCISSRQLRIHPTVPSPPQTSTLYFWPDCDHHFKACCGDSSRKSTTCTRCNRLWSSLSSSVPWPPPERLFTKTRRGRIPLAASGLIVSSSRFVVRGPPKFNQSIISVAFLLNRCVGRPVLFSSS
mmetsp:Transcript_39320/g.113780  ORF Transcript_39320/g.113780 Transcript_39320/m.113780 type:complete len:206 (+) Transcript_39320:884-1501(+)